MRMAWTVIAVLAVVHILAVLGAVGFLAASGRLNANRMERIAEIFRKTLGEEEAERAVAAKVETDATEQAIKLAESQAAGQSTESRVEAERERREMMLRQLERTRQDVESLQRNLQLAQWRVRGEHEQILSEKKTLEDRIREMTERLNDEGFKKAVALYEGLPPKQVKDMFLNLMGQDQADQVVSYLEAMEPRKAAGVLKEFKSAEELAKAVDLTERLRARGSDLVKSASSPTAPGAPVSNKAEGVG